MERTLYIMRGLPGSGKSTRAKAICDEALRMGANGAVICSTDDFFMVNGEYRFNRESLGYNHSQNQSRVNELMTQKVDAIVVDNTNIKRRDMQSYLAFAEHHGYAVQEVVIGAESMRADLNTYIKTCHERNTHGVPLETIQRMARTFEL